MRGMRLGLGLGKGKASSGPVAAVNPTISADSFTAGGSGNPAAWTVEGGYTGSDTLVLEGVTGTDPITVSAAQLTAGSGGTNTLEFFTIDPFTFSSSNDLPGLTATSESATRIAYQVREKNNGGTTSVQTPADVISGLDYTVPVWGSGITAASSVDGLSIVLTSSEALYLANDFADWTVAGAASTPSVNAISGSGTTSITLGLSAAIANGETITLDFADTDTNLRDAAGNLIGDIGTPISVTNNVPAAGGVTLTYFSGASNGADLSSYTFSSVTLPTTGEILVGILGRAVSPETGVATSVSVGGDAATLVTENSTTFSGTSLNNHSAQLWRVAAPGGSTGDIVVGYGGTQKECRYFLVGMTGAAAGADATAQDAATSGTTQIDLDVNTTANGAVVAVVQNWVYGNDPSPVLTGVTLAGSVATGAIAVTDGISAETPRNIQITTDQTGGFVGVAASFGAS